MSILTDIKPYILPDFRGVILPTFTVPADLKAAAGAAADCSNAEFLKQLCRVGFVAKLDHLDDAKRREYGAGLYGIHTDGMGHLQVCG